MSSKLTTKRETGEIETPVKRRRVTASASSVAGPSTTRRRLNSEAIPTASPRIRRTTRSQKQDLSGETPVTRNVRRTTRLRSTASRLSQPLEQDESTPRAQSRSQNRLSQPRSLFRPRESLLQPLATPLTIERRAGLLRDVAKAVLLEYIMFSDATEKHANVRRVNWTKLQGAHMILSDEPTPTFLDLETVIGALPTKQKQYILNGQIPSLQQGLDLSNVIGFLHIIIDPVLASTSVVRPGRTPGEAVTDVMLLAWKRFWTTLVGRGTSETEAMTMWLDFATQIYLQSKGLVDPHLTSPSRRPPISNQQDDVEDVFAYTAYEQYAVKDANLDLTGDLTRKGLKQWAQVSTTRRKLLAERDGTECRRLFPYETFRTNMIGFVITVLGRSRMLDMSAHQLAAAIDGDDPEGITSDEVDSEAVASGLEPETESSDEDAEVAKEEAETAESTEDQERVDQPGDVDDYIDEELLHQVAMELDLETRFAPEDNEEDGWSVRDSSQPGRLLNAPQGPGFTFAAAQATTDRIAFDSEEDVDTPIGKSARTTSDKALPATRLTTPRRTSSLLQRSRDVFDKALTPSKWGTSLLFRSQPRPTGLGAPRSPRLPSSENSVGAEPPIDFQDDNLLPSTQALADDASVQSSPGRALSPPLASESLEEEEEEEEEGEETPQDSGHRVDVGSTHLSLLPPSQAFEDDKSVYSEDGDDETGQVYSDAYEVYNEQESQNEAASEEERREASQTPLAVRKSPAVKPRVSQSLTRPKLPRPSDNDFISENDSEASAQRSAPPQVRVNGLERGQVAPRNPSGRSSSSESDSSHTQTQTGRVAVPRDASSGPSRLSTVPRTQRQALASAQASNPATASYQLPASFRETYGRVTQLYASDLGGTDPFMVDEDGEPLEPQMDLCMRVLGRPKNLVSTTFGRTDGQTTTYSRLDGSIRRWAPDETYLLYRTVQKTSENEMQPLQVVARLHGEFGIRSQNLAMFSTVHMRDKLKEVVKSRLRNGLPVVGNVRVFADRREPVRVALDADREEGHERRKAEETEQLKERIRLAEEQKKKKEAERATQVQPKTKTRAKAKAKPKPKKKPKKKAKRKDKESESEVQESEEEEDEEDHEETEEKEEANVRDEITVQSADDAEQANAVDEAPPAQAKAAVTSSRRRPSQPRKRAASQPTPEVHTDAVDSEAPSDRRRLRSHTSREPENGIDSVQQPSSTQNSRSLSPKKKTAKRKMTPVAENEDVTEREDASDDDMGQTQAREMIARAVAERQLCGSPEN